MKTMIEIIVVIVIIVTLNSLATGFLNNEVDYYTKKIDDIYLNIEQNNIENAYEQIDNITDRWEDTNVIWSVLTGHDDMENIELIMNKLKDHNVSSHIDNASIDLIELKAVIEHNAKKYNINIKNIF